MKVFDRVEKRFAQMTTLRGDDFFQMKGECMGGEPTKKQRGK